MGRPKMKPRDDTKPPKPSKGKRAAVWYELEHRLHRNGEVIKVLLQRTLWPVEVTVGGSKLVLLSRPGKGKGERALDLDRSSFDGSPLSDAKQVVSDSSCESPCLRLNVVRINPGSGKIESILGKDRLIRVPVVLFGSGSSVELKLTITCDGALTDSRKIRFRCRRLSLRDKFLEFLRWQNQLIYGPAGGGYGKNGELYLTSKWNSDWGGVRQFCATASPTQGAECSVLVSHFLAYWLNFNQCYTVGTGGVGYGRSLGIARSARSREGKKKYNGYGDFLEPKGDGEPHTMAWWWDKELSVYSAPGDIYVCATRGHVYLLVHLGHNFNFPKHLLLGGTDDSDCEEGLYLVHASGPNVKKEILYAGYRARGKKSGAGRPLSRLRELAKGWSGKRGDDPLSGRPYAELVRRLDTAITMLGGKPTRPRKGVKYKPGLAGVRIYNGTPLGLMNGLRIEAYRVIELGLVVRSRPGKLEILKVEKKWAIKYFRARGRIIEIQGKDPGSDPHEQLCQALQNCRESGEKLVLKQQGGPRGHERIEFPVGDKPRPHEQRVFVTDHGTGLDGRPLVRVVDGDQKFWVWLVRGELLDPATGMLCCKEPGGGKPATKLPTKMWRGKQEVTVDLRLHDCSSLRTVEEGAFAAKAEQNEAVDSSMFVDYLPVTGGNEVEFFVDGRQYGAALLAELEQASKRVLLTGLHFQPSWRFVRGRNGAGTTLVQQLSKMAQRGVEIYLVVNQFWEDESNLPPGTVRHTLYHAAALQNYLPQTASLFQQLSKYSNVHCRTDVHPGAILATHHQKTVVIDDVCCFVGGIDLTLIDGDRWDSGDHEIPPTADDDLREYKLHEHLWHDVHCRIRGPAVAPVVDNFYARWNHGKLYKDLVLDEITTGSRDYQSVEMGGKSWALYTRGKLTGKLDDVDRPRLSPRPTLAGGVYPDLTRQQGTAVHSRSGSPSSPEKAGDAELSALPKMRVQVVRSMPAGKFTYEQQKPRWNLSTKEWERSARDAYLIGIRAAREYIYLENQWIADEKIWQELKLAMLRNRDNPDFRIVVVIPRKPLSAAGLGRDQEIDLDEEVKGVAEACGHTAQFGVYSPEQVVPRSRRDSIDLSTGDLQRYEGKTTQIYVHSKVMIVDDCWSLIGSANAGGISLLGVFNLKEALRHGSGSTPDSELSVIIHDHGMARGLRETLWKEHLRCRSLPASPAEAADLFRAHARAKDKRVRYAVVYNEATKEDRELLYKVRPDVVAGVRAGSWIKPSFLCALTPQLMGKASFEACITRPPSSYRVRLCWTLRWASLDWTLASGRGATAYLPARLKVLLSRDKAKRATVRCRVEVVPRKMPPEVVVDDQNCFVLECPVRFDFEGK